MHFCDPGANRALDLVNFFVADVQTGFGPFVAVYLTTHKWTQVDIGFALTLGTMTSLISQLPAGALVDSMRNKRMAASGALVGIIIAARAAGSASGATAGAGRPDAARFRKLRDYAGNRGDQPASGGSCRAG